MAETRQIYVALLEEGVDVWRPVEAQRVSEDLYTLSGAIPEGQVWEFRPGGVVRCRERMFSDGKTGLVRSSECEPVRVPALATSGHPIGRDEGSVDLEVGNGAWCRMVPPT